MQSLHYLLTYVVHDIDLDTLYLSIYLAYLLNIQIKLILARSDCPSQSPLTRSQSPTTHISALYECTLEVQVV